ncbi:MAG TPA: DUF3090 family protein [Chloroflexia bacterium]|nr:DUF3090 family protein [Chloroflexia bacterium]
MSMRRPRHNMGRIDWIGAEAIGVPGQRTFRVLVQSQAGAAQLWMEKEQLQQLAEAIARMAVEIDTERGSEVRNTPVLADNPKPPDFPANPAIEIRVGTLGLRYDPQRDLIALEAYDVEAPEGEVPAFRCLATRRQMETLQANSLEVVSSGRPRCPFCHAPLPSVGMPHFCPPTNGHQKLSPDED